MPLDAFVEHEILELDGLLAKGQPGVSVYTGNAAVTGYDMDNITPQKMQDPAEAARALAAIRKAGREGGFFR